MTNKSDREYFDKAVAIRVKNGMPTLVNKGKQSIPMYQLSTGDKISCYGLTLTKDKYGILVPSLNTEGVTQTDFESEKELIDLFNSRRYTEYLHSFVEYVKQMKSFSQESKIKIRYLTFADMNELIELEADAIFSISDMISEDDTETSGYALGIFIGKRLVGYCSLGGADVFEDLDDKQADDKCLSDLYINPLLRGRGLGSKLVNFAIECANQDNFNIYLQPWEPGQENYYKRFGFKPVENYMDELMVYKCLACQ